jgi:hypothetical protein
MNARVMAQRAELPFRATYVGGPRDGLEIEIPRILGHLWARVDWQGKPHYYVLTWTLQGFRYVYEPEAHP